MEYHEPKKTRAKARVRSSAVPHLRPERPPPQALTSYSLKILYPLIMVLSVVYRDIIFTMAAEQI